MTNGKGPKAPASSEPTYMGEYEPVPLDTSLPATDEHDLFAAEELAATIPPAPPADAVPPPPPPDAMLGGPPPPPQMPVNVRPPSVAPAHPPPLPSSRSSAIRPPPADLTLPPVDATLVPLPGPAGLPRSSPSAVRPPPLEPTVVPLPGSPLTPSNLPTARTHVSPPAPTKSSTSAKSLPSVMVEKGLSQPVLPMVASHTPVQFAAVPAPPAVPLPAPSNKSSQSNSNLTPAGRAAKEYTSPDAAVGPGAVEPAAGVRIHHYELIRLLGRGGMGSVWLGRDTRLGRRVAIKFLTSQSADLTKRFVLEARTTAACNHENIVVIYEVDAWQGAPFMVFEYLQGQTLTKLMPEGKALPVPRAVELMVPVVRALAAAHAQGIVHRDLKPDNIIVSESGTIKVLDFGIAKVLQSEELSKGAAAEVHRPRATASGNVDDEEDDKNELTRVGAMMGTLSYMAPEQWGIGVPIDHRADLWSVGIMLYKMLAGKHPLDPLRGQQLMVTGILTEPMPMLAQVAPDVPRELAAVVDKCLLKHKDKRMPDAVSLLRALEPFLPGRYTRELKIDESPYAGLASFQESDADRFFGRTHEVAAMVNQVRERPLLAVVGASGAGKSSFVRAGLVPALKRSGEAWETVVLRPGRNPLAALASVVGPMVSTSVSVADDLAEQKKLADRIAAEPGLVGSVLRAKARREKKNVLLFIDQFEELYTMVPEQRDRLAFTSVLNAVADDATSPIRVVISIRSDFLDRVPEDRAFMAELNHGLFFLSAPGREGLKDAIVMPAEMARYKFESQDIVDDMLVHLETTPGALPLLQFCAAKLWETRDAAKRLLTKASYDSIGGVGGALASHADAVVSRLPPQTQPMVRAIFLQLVTADRTRALVSMDELKGLSKHPAEVQNLVDTLVQARLLVVQTGGGVATVEIVHESLLSTWPMLKRWLDETGEDAAFVEQVRTAARQWHAKRQPVDLLWRGELADEAGRFHRRFRGQLTDVQKHFLDAVVSEAQRSARRRRTAMGGVVVGLSAVLAVVLVLLVIAQAAKDEAVKQQIAAVRAKAEAERNADEAKEKEKERAKAAEEAMKGRKDLAESNTKLEQALKEAEESAEEARKAEVMARTNASAALKARKKAEDAKARADEARRETQSLLAREKDRAQKLEEQLGSPVIDTLK